MEPTSHNCPPSAYELWRRLRAHDFENPHQARDLVRRLSMEQGWSMERSRQAVDEYRKFCFLAVICTHPVTPSEEVDAVWHLHLLHTRDYWEEFCPRILGRPLHHGPTKGGVQEEGAFMPNTPKPWPVIKSILARRQPSGGPVPSNDFSPPFTTAGCICPVCGSSPSPPRGGLPSRPIF